MARYDPDRIADLAGGLLQPAEAADLEREIAADPRAVAELAAQRLALRALRRAPAPVLSAEERAELGRAVAAALNLSEAPQLEAASRRRRLPWRPIAVAAAALVVVAAVVPLVGLLSTGEDRAALTTPAAAEFDARTLAGETGTPGATAPATEEALTDDGDLGAGLLTVEGAEAAADGLVEDLLADPGSLIALAEADLVTCEAEAAALLGEDSHPAAAALTREAQELVVWFVSADGTTLQSLAVFDPGDCRLLASHP